MVPVDEKLEVVNYYIGANVELAADVVVAAGAVLEAAPGARLVVAAGVCVGPGVIVQASGGKLTIGTGVSLGMGVLILGQGVVNAHACVGAESTLLNPQVVAGAVIPARSLLGTPDHLEGDRPEAVQNGQSPSPAVVDTSSQADAEAAHGSADSAAVANPEAALDNHAAPAKIVYGRDQKVQLMQTLFPHHDALNHNGDNANNGNSS